jgi:hypothetical protein
MHELGLIGAGKGGGFAHTSELKVMKYKEASHGRIRQEIMGRGGWGRAQ